MISNNKEEKYSLHNLLTFQLQLLGKISFQVRLSYFDSKHLAYHAPF
jgi:hypothetical protein